MYSYGNASTHVGGLEGVPVPKVAAAPTGFAGWTVCHCGLKHRPGAFHICIDLSEPAPKLPPKKVATPKSPKAKRVSKPRRAKKATTKRGPGPGYGGGINNHGGRVVSRADEVIRRYQSGETTRSIAADLGVSANPIRNLLRRNGITLRPSHEEQRGVPRLSLRRLTDEQVTEAAEAYLAGATTSSLGKRYGVGDTTIAETLRRHGVTIRSAGETRRGMPNMARRALTLEQDAEVAELYVAGASMAVLAEKYSISEPAIRSSLKRTGTPPRRPGAQRREVA